MVKAILFDLDGTLLDTAPDLARCLNLLLEKYHYPVLDYKVIRPYVSRGSKGLINLGFAKHLSEYSSESEALNEFERLRQEYLQIYLQNLCIETQFFPEIKTLLFELQKLDISWGIVTNKPGFLTNGLLEQAFDKMLRPACVVSGDTCARAKPYPDPLLHAAQLLNIQPENCLYIGDNEIDVIAAKKAQMPVITVGYGYTLEEEKPCEWGADGYCDSPAELYTQVTSKYIFLFIV